MADTVQQMKIKVIAEGIEQATAKMNGMNASMSETANKCKAANSAQTTLDASLRDYVNQSKNAREVTEKLNRKYEESKIAAKQYNDELKAHHETIGRVKSQVLSLVGTYLTLRAAIGLGKAAFEDWKNQELALKNIYNAVEQTGWAAGISARQTALWAAELQKVSNFADEKILDEVFNKLIRLNNVQGSMIKTAAELAVNLSAASRGEIDLGSAANIVGKALEDPLTATRQLRTARILLTTAEKELIKQFMESGRLADAQAVIMNRLDLATRNAAKATIDATQQMKNSWSDYLEVVGKGIGELGMKIAGLVSKLLSVNNTIAASFEYKRPLEELKKEWKFLTSEERATELGSILAGMQLAQQAAEKMATAGSRSAANNIRKDMELLLLWRNSIDFPTVARRKQGTDTGDEQGGVAGKEYYSGYREAVAADLAKNRAVYEAWWKAAQAKQSLMDTIFNTDLVSGIEVGDAMYGIDAMTDGLDEMSQAWVDFNAAIQPMVENVLSNALTTMILSAESAAEKWAAIWADIASSAIREIDRIIAKMIVLDILKPILGFIFPGAGSVFDVIGGMFGLSTGGNTGSGTSSSANLNPIGLTSISRDIKDGFSSIRNNQQPITVYVSPRDIARAAELGTTLRYI